MLAGKGLSAFKKAACPEENFISYTIDPQKDKPVLYWKDDNGKVFSSISNLKNYLSGKHRKLVFAMNGGMYQEDQSPLGLYIENFKTLCRINKRSGGGNFYMQPNGIFYIRKNNTAAICSTAAFHPSADIKYATQSGTMLVVNGAINTLFKDGSNNLNIRNGVGILPDTSLVFAMSRHEVSFYDFAAFFKSKGCINALYLDGFVSRTYLPAKNWLQEDGKFGVIIGVDQPQ